MKSKLPFEEYFRVSNFIKAISMYDMCRYDETIKVYIYNLDKVAFLNFGKMEYFYTTIANI